MSGVTINLSTEVTSDGNTLTNVENASGSRYDDIIIGDGNNNTLIDDGNDTLDSGLAQTILWWWG